MAARQGSQSSAMLYALITFVALFVVATVFAIVFYVKSEDYRTQSQSAKDDLNRVVNSSERNALARIVGRPEQGKSYMGTMQNVADSLYTMILGQEASAEVPATVKFNEISMKTKAVLESLDRDVTPAFGPDGVALLQTVISLKQKLENARAEIANLKDVADTLQVGFEDARAQAEQSRQEYVAELAHFQAEFDQIRDRFSSLQRSMSDSTMEQVQSFKDKLEEEQARIREKQLALQEAENRLSERDKLLQAALVKLDSLKPNPDKEVQAFKPDANIISVDLRNGIVFLDIGIKDHAYRGLTFAVYDRNKPIPEDGQGKAEIEIFQISEHVSAARILRSDRRNPVVQEDIVANLIWDSGASNRFVVVGEFDINNDGRINADGAQRIMEMIERWGGSIMQDITIETDFLVIGIEPEEMPRPTQDELDMDPFAQQRFEQSQAKVKEYNDLLMKANALGIPVFNQKRFMYLIGYDTLLNRNPML